MIRAATSLVRTIYGHPYNRRRPLFALYRMLRWQWHKRVRGTPVVYRFWGTRRVLCYPDALGSMWLVYMYFMDWPEFWFLKRYLRADDVTVDVGANLGIYTLWMSQFTRGRQYAFEADRRNFHRTVANVALNELSDRVTVHHAAVSDRSGTAFFTQGRDTENHLLPPDAPAANAQQVTTVSLDDFAEDNRIDRIHFLKIDVEGAEYLVCQGAARLLRQRRIDVIEIEVLDLLSQFGRDRSALYDLLTAHGYSFFEYDPEANVLRNVHSLREVPQNVFAMHDFARVEARLRGSVAV